MGQTDLLAHLLRWGVLKLVTVGSALRIAATGVWSSAVVYSVNVVHLLMSDK